MTYNPYNNRSASGPQVYAEIAFDYEGSWQEKLISQLPGFLRVQPRVKALVRSLGGGVQALEDLLWGMVTGSIIDSAEGTQLERWGKLVDEPRGSLISDANYRPIIKAKILANNCTGDIDSVMEVLSVVCEPVVCIEHIPLYPGGYHMQVVRESFMTDARRLRARRILQLLDNGTDSRYIEAVNGGFMPPTGGCGLGSFNGPISREI